MLKSVFLIITLLFGSSPIFAQDPLDNGAYYELLSLNLRYNYFLTDSVSDFSNPITLGFDTQIGNSTESRRWEIDGYARYFEKNDMIGVSVKNAYYEWIYENWDLALGRKYLDWNQAEDFWSIAKFQPLRGFNLLDTKKEGLTGIHSRFRSGDLKISGFLTYIYFPQLNPGVKVENDKLVGANEWAQNPPTKAESNGADIDILYDIEQPPYNEVIYKPGYGLEIEYGKEDLSLSAFMARKPESKIRYAVTALLDPAEDELSVTIDPSVNYHTIYGASLRTDQDGWATHLSFFVDQPDQGVEFDLDDVDGVEFESELASESYLLVGASKDFYGVWNVQVEYISNFEERTDANDLINEAPTWVNALGVQAIHRPNETFELTANARKDFDTYGGIYRLMASKRFNEDWKGTFAIELIEAEDTDTYWASYRSNDSVWIQADYLF